MNRPRVALDFDGVLHAGGFHGIVPEGPPVPGALGFVHWLARTGHDPFVLTSRAVHGRGRIEVEHWLTAHGFPKMQVTATKLPAVLYIDDRAFRMVGDFAPAMELLAADMAAMDWIR